LPQTLADRAERAARRRGIPRSRLYALALEAFLVDEQETNEELTAQLNAVLADEAVRTEEDRAEDEALEVWLSEGGRRTWDSVEWKGERCAGGLFGGGPWGGCSNGPLRGGARS